MENHDDILLFVAELDAQRAAMGMSYQDVADACDVSKATVYRALNGKTEPTMHLLQNIAAAVQYKEEREDILPDDLTTEAYIAYLKQLIRQKDAELGVRTRQLHSHYNKLLRQSSRRETRWAAIAIVLMLAIIGLFLYDFLHLDRGWIQTAYSGYRVAAREFFLAAKEWIESVLV